MSKQVLISAEEAPHFAMRCFTIQPGGKMPLHTNTVEHEQFVLSGKAEVTLGVRSTGEVGWGMEDPCWQLQPACIYKPGR